MLTQLTFVSWWQMIYDAFISSHMITHWCFLLPWCSGWAVCLLCAECTQPLVTVQSSKPALETGTYLGSFIWLYCWSSSAKQKMCRVPSISHLQMFDLTIAVMLPKGRRGGFTHTREWGGQTKGSCSKAHPTYQQIQSLLHRHSISIHNFLPWCKPPLPPPRIYPTYIL